MKKLFFVNLLFVIFSCSSDEATLAPSMNKPKEDTESNDDPENPQEEQGGNTSTDFYRFATYGTTTADPFDVNMLFHVSDSVHRGVANLNIDNFIIKENEEDIPLTESKAVITDLNSFNLKMKTALVIDVSQSVQDDFDTLKSALIALIDQKADYQEIAIFSFSSTTKLVLDYSNDVSSLKNAVNSLEIGTSSTDLYGAVVTAANSFQNGYKEDLVTIGNLVVFTDGDDTQASTTLASANESIINKNAYFIGLQGPDLDEQNILDLVGQDFYYPTSTIDLASTNFDLVLEEILNYGSSIYLLNYESPKRGSNEHSLRVFHSSNNNYGIDNFAVGSFLSIGFYEPVSPTKATLISPTLNEEITLKNYCSVTFTIGNSTDQNTSSNDKVVYELYFGESPETLVRVDELETTFDVREFNFESPSKLIPGKKYYWQIVTKDDDLEELDVSSDVGEFIFKEAIYEGNITISNSDEMENFCFSKITGNLILSNNPFGIFDIITDFTPLDVLERIEGFLRLSNDNETRSLNILPNLTYLGSSMEISNNDNLELIMGFNNLSNGLNNIIIRGNNKLRTINGFNLIPQLGSLNIDSNIALQEIIGLNSVAEISKNLIIKGEVISRLDLMNNLVRIRGEMQIEAPIGDLSGFNSLLSITKLQLVNLASLEQISGFSSLENVIEMSLINLPALRTLTGFNSLRAISNLTLNDLNLLQSVPIFTNLNEVTNFGINRSSFDDLSPFRSINSINNLTLGGNENLVSLGGLNENVRLNYLNVSGNGNLTSLNGISNNLNSSMSRVDINNNDMLGSLEGLNNIEIITSDLVISKNNSLIDLTGLNGMKSVNNLGVRDNGNLINLKGLGNELDFQITMALTIYNNSLLTDLCNLATINPEIIGDNYFVSENTYNPTLTELVGGNCKL